MHLILNSFLKLVTSTQGNFFSFHEFHLSSFLLVLTSSKRWMKNSPSVIHSLSLVWQILSKGELFHIVSYCRFLVQLTNRMRFRFITVVKICCGLTRRKQLWTRFDLFLTTIFNNKENVYFRAWPRSWHKEKASVVYNFFAILLVYFPKWVFLIGYYNCMTHQHEHDAIMVV